MDDGQYQLWWEEHWNERAHAIARCFGHDDIPHMVTSFSFHLDPPDLSMLIPGACAMHIPPAIGKRFDVCVSQGFAPLTEDPARRGGAVEFVIITDGEVEWANTMLGWTMRGFHKDRDAVERIGTEVTGTPLFGPSPIADDPREWKTILTRLLHRPASVSTATGGFRLLAVTVVTDDEFSYIEESSLAHLQLALCRGGVHQVSDPDRASVFAGSECDALRADLSAMGLDEVRSELDDRARAGWL